MRYVTMVAILASVIAATAFAQSAAVEIAQADALYDRWNKPFDFQSYEADLRAAIALWEEALPLVPAGQIETSAHVLNRLSQAYFELGEAYLTSSSDKEAAFGMGKDYALASLRLDPVFDETEARDGFRAALQSASDVAAIFWYGNCVGSWLNYHQLTAIMGGVRDVLASYERAVELDEAFFGGGPQRSLGSLIAQAYFVIGHSQSDCVEPFERAMELDGRYLENLVNYVEHYAIRIGDAALAARLLEEIARVADDPEAVAAWPLYNHLALARAESLDGIVP